MCVADTTRTNVLVAILKTIDQWTMAEARVAPAMKGTAVVQEQLATVRELNLSKMGFHLFGAITAKCFQSNRNMKLNMKCSTIKA